MSQAWAKATTYLKQYRCKKIFMDDFFSLGSFFSMLFHVQGVPVVVPAPGRRGPHSHPHHRHRLYLPLLLVGDEDGDFDYDEMIMTILTMIAVTLNVAQF